MALKSSDGKKTIYIINSALKTARSATNAKVFSRCLLEGVFTDDALYKCTLTGGEYRAGGKANIVRKPQLDQDAISIILGTLWPINAPVVCFSHNFICVIIIFSLLSRCRHGQTKEKRLETVS